jgi:hypothetical protein
MYFLSIGNSAYREDTFNTFPDNMPNVVADEIAQKLREAGAVDGRTLKSEPGYYLTREKVLSELDRIASKAKAARNPLVVYYFIGHGEEKDLVHVSILGHYKKSDDIDVKKSSSIITTKEVMAHLDDKNLSYILILDNCYGREPLPPLDEFARIWGGTYISILDRLLQITSGTPPKIVLYAAKPGDQVPALDHPVYEGMGSGPLARRLLLLLMETFKSQKDLTVGNFLQQMNNPNFDPNSVPGHHTEWIENSGSTVLIPAGARSKPIESDR